MKVVLFCGGFGLRIRDVAPEIPKPMMSVDGLPILLQIMKYYAHWGHCEFILCLGYKADVIRDFFARHGEEVVPNGSNCSSAVTRSIFHDGNRIWNVQLVETGLHASIGERLRSVRCFVEDDE